MHEDFGCIGEEHLSIFFKIIMDDQCVWKVQLVFRNFSSRESMRYVNVGSRIAKKLVKNHFCCNGGIEKNHGDT